MIAQGSFDGSRIGKVLIVQSTPNRSAARALTQQQGRFQLLVRGCENGEPVNRTELIDVIARIAIADDEWRTILDATASPALRWIVSNTTEAGLTLAAADDALSIETVPVSFPGKLARLLQRRFDEGGAPLVVAPCELVPDNGDRLRELVCQQAEVWKFSESLMNWIRSECVWLNTLVDRMVTAPASDDPALESDPCSVVAEPFQMWAIAKPAAGQRVPFFEHSAIQWCDSLEEVALRKFRILNGCHTAMVARALPAGAETVRDVMESSEHFQWVRGLAYEEILPTLTARGFSCSDFCETTFERFRNPFAHHRLADIALNHAAKVESRLLPIRDDFVRIFKRVPDRLNQAIEAAID